MEPSGNKVPRHVGIIIDGNRRFAKKLMLKPWKGHEYGADKVEKLLDWCREYGIQEITIYAFSWENLNRPKQEFDYLMKVFSEAFDKLMKDKRLQEEEIKVNFIGRISRFPTEIYQKMLQLMEMTKNNSKYIVNFAMAYGGRTEVVDATRKIAEQIKQGKLDVEQINEEVFEKNLYMKDEPDLIIRTGGDRRTSNFLIWQGSYAEWVFLEKTWPEFEKEDLKLAIEDYSSRERRFGK